MTTQSAHCQTVRLLRLLSAHRKAGRPCHWRTTSGRVWLSTGDPAPAITDAARRFPGEIGEK